MASSPYRVSYRIDCNENYSFSITSNIQTSPIKLITAYKQTYKALLSNPELKLLGD